MTDTSNTLNALSPLDGRYRSNIAPLAAYFSESALYRYRVRVEIEYLIFLARAPSVTCVAPLSPQQQAALRACYRHFGDEDAAAIADWDRRINHDVKAVEYWLGERFAALDLAQWIPAIHFALTSEDVNNLAYALSVREARDLVLLPVFQEIHLHLHDASHQEAATVMLARTHGQPASPTTMGKELAVFARRLNRAYTDLATIPLTGKLTGATGTFGAHVVALPDVDWITFSRAFVRSLDLEPVVVTTQIEPHDSLAAVCDALKRTNTILLDLAQDCWRYISDGYFVQAVHASEVGSSTMPHKVNPIDFENAEGNFGLANALLEFFSRKLPISRLQRDLSDSTVLRNLGVAFGYSLLGAQRIFRGLQRISVDAPRLRDEVQQHPEVLAEAIQTVLRSVGHPHPYEMLKSYTRGKPITLESLRHFITELDIDPIVKERLLQLTPEQYIGLAETLARLPEKERHPW